MKKIMQNKSIIRALSISVISAMIGLIYIGSRVNIDKTIKPVRLPKDLEDLDLLIKKKEKKFNDIIPGTEKNIVWANPLKKQKTKTALIYIHGFSSTKKDISPVPENVAKNLKANIFYTRLKGHGQGGNALAKASVNDWINDLVEAIEIGKKIGDNVVIISFSTGASLSLWLAAEVKNMNDKILALVFISPNFGVKQSSSEFLLGPWGKAIARIIIGSNRSWEPLNPQQERYWTTSYPVEALLPMMETVKLAREAKVEEIKQPTLIIFSPFDKVVNTQKIENIFSRLGTISKRKIYMKGIVYINESQDPYNHIIVGDIVSPMNNEIVTQNILNFLEPLL